MPLPQSRIGNRLEVKGRPVPFSYWPSRPGRRHYALQSLLFALHPWVVIERAIIKHCSKPRQPEALACVEQARDFYTAASQSGIIAARPLALYYSFMNLAKAFCLTRGTRSNFDQAQHGLSEKLKPSTQELVGAHLEAWQTPNNQGSSNIFAEFMEVLTNHKLAGKFNYDLPVLIPQIVAGHRMWAVAAGEQERFIAAYDIQFWQDHACRHMWLNIYFVAHDLTRLGVTHDRLLKESGLGPEFRQVSCEATTTDNQPLLCFEQANPATYKHYPADELSTLVKQVRNRLWVTVATVPPYRRFYVYLAPPSESPFVLPQILSIYALAYYLGSITRYRPHHYDRIIQGPFGPRMEEFVAGQPLQFIYLMASEFALQDVTKPSII